MPRHPLCRVTHDPFPRISRLAYLDLSRALGSIADLGAYSFHETRNVISDKGGALLVNALSMRARAEIIREKGTGRITRERLTIWDRYHQGLEPLESRDLIEIMRTAFPNGFA